MPVASFGNAGMASFPSAAVGDTYDFRDIAVKTDGSFYAAGETFSSHIVVASLTALGALDMRFAGMGFTRVVPDPAPGFLGVELFSPQVGVAGQDAVHVAREFLVTGCLRCSPFYRLPTARKVDASGVPATTWANNGRAQSALLPHSMAFTSSGFLHVYGYQLGGDERLLQVIEPSGAIREPRPYGSPATMCSGTGRIGDLPTLAAGDGDQTIAAWTVSHTPAQSSVCVTRRLADGSPAANFGVEGVARLPDFAFGDHEHKLAGRPGGGVVIAFRARLSGPPWLAALRADGSLDTAFGNAGALRAIPGVESQVDVLAVQPDGKVLVGQRSRLVRLDASGMLDRSFGTDGFVELTVGGRWLLPSQLRVLPDWRLLLAGASYPCANPNDCISGPGMPALMMLLGGER